MTNLEKWHNFCRDLPSPDSFIETCFYSMIGAALQRRVYLGSGQDLETWPNDYFILVGPPAAGKGLAMKPVEKIMRAMKLHTTAEAPELDHSMDSMAGIERAESLVCPMSADCATLEVITHNLAKQRRAYNKVIGTLPDGSIKTKRESYSSMYFQIEELGTLFRAQQGNTTDLINFLIKGWDAGDYLKETKHSGTDDVKRICLSLLAGTTPDFILKLVKTDVLGTGFASRIVFVYEKKQRKNIWMIKHDNEQREQFKQIAEYIYKLTKIQGLVEYTEEADKFCEKAFVEDIETLRRVNKHVKLNEYYSRKKAHFMKRCLAIHLSENPTLRPIELHTAELAMAQLEQLEINMHKPLLFAGANETAHVAAQILEYIQKKGEVEFREILFRFLSDLDAKEQKEILEMWEAAGKIRKSLKGGLDVYTATETEQRETTMEEPAI